MQSDSPYGFVGDYVLWWLLCLSLLVHIAFFFRFFPRRRHRWAGLVLGNALVFLGLLGSLGLLAETYLRFFHVRLDAFGVSLPAQRWFQRYVRLNPMGFRDKEWTVPKPAGVRRIAFVGDSFTYGWGIERIEDRFPDRLQARFDARAAVGPALSRSEVVEVMNVAKPAWDTAAELTAIGEIITRSEVDEVVLCYVPNDIEKLLPRTAEFDPTLPPEPVYVNISSSCVVDWLYRRIWLPRAATIRGYHDWLAEGFADADIWRDHQRQLRDLIGECRDRGATVRVVLLPFLRVNGEKFDTPRLHGVLRRFFETNGVEALDLAPTIAGRAADELTVSTMDSHPNENAHELWAEAVWQRFYPPAPAAGP